MRKLWLLLAGAFAMALAAVLFVNARESAIKDEKQRLSVVPPQCAVSHVLYAKEETSGFGLSGDVDSKVASDIDDSICSPGSFYAATRYGVWIVIPAKNKVVYAYRS